MSQVTPSWDKALSEAFDSQGTMGEEAWPNQMENPLSVWPQQFRGPVMNHCHGEVCV